MHKALRHHALLGRATATTTSSSSSSVSSSSRRAWTSTALEKKKKTLYYSPPPSRTAPVYRRVSSLRAMSSSSSSSSSSSTKHDLKLLFDGECPLCVREVDFLKSRNEKGLINFVDLADPSYSAEENGGIDYETGMATIHGIYKGEIVTGVEVFEKAYSCVGLGWVYSFTKVPALLNAANKVYDVWAKYRLEITGRPSLGDVLKARKMRAEEKSCAEATEGECNI